MNMESQPVRKGVYMVTIFKWITVLVLAALSWLVGIITLEYFRPYKKVPIRVK